MKTYKITQVRSTIGTTPNQKLNMKSLGLKKIGHSVERAANEATEGLLRKVAHLVKIDVIS